MLDLSVLFEIEERPVIVGAQVEVAARGDELVPLVEATATISPDGAMMALPPMSSQPSSVPALATPTTHVLF